MTRLPKIPPHERPTCTSTSTARYERQHELKQFKVTFVSLGDLEVKLDMATLPNSITKSRYPSRLMFFSVSYEGKPEINYCLKLNNDLQFVHWCNGQIENSENHSDEEISSCSSLRSCKLLLKMLNYLQAEFNNRSAGVCTDKENDIIDIIKVEHLDDNKKIAFLSEQKSLVFSSPMDDVTRHLLLQWLICGNLRPLLYINKYNWKEF